MIRITSLIDNERSDRPQLESEHGLSLFIETHEGRYLLDTGASDRFIGNAIKMGIDLGRLDGVIISHNHYDHIGGLKALLRFNPSVKVYIKRKAKGIFFSKRDEGTKYIGASPSLLLNSNRFIFIDDSLKLSDQISLQSNTVDDKHFRAKDSRLKMLKGIKIVADSFDHELFMTIEDEGGITILSSCSHNGIVNIVRSVQREHPTTPIKGIVGGFHLKSLASELSPEQTQEHIGQIASMLTSSCQGAIYTCHCTGIKGYQMLKGVMGERIHYLGSGDVIRI